MAWSVFWQIERVNVEDIRCRQKGRIRIMKKRITALVLSGVIMISSLFTGCSSGQENTKNDTSVIELLNVSYDPTREFYTAYNELFCEHWKETGGQDIKIT